MRLLLDTHAVLWFCEGNTALSAAARSAMSDQKSECWVSHATPWEVAIKLSLRKLKLGRPFGMMFPTTVVENGWRFLVPDFSHYAIVIELPQHHRDPFDRLIIAQASAEGLTVVTSDPQFAAYDVPLLW